jgi:hypothetical protein
MSGKSDARTRAHSKALRAKSLRVGSVLRQLEECGASSHRFSYSLRSEVGG